MSNTKPTRPGWWWWQWGEDEPEVLFLENLEAAYSGPQWLAPIPSPAVCVAVAAYKAAIDARDGEEEARVRRIREGGSNSATVLEELVEEVEYRAEMLAYALRAELGEVDG